MADPVDLFADGFRVFIGAFGCTLDFSVTTPEGHATTSPETELPANRVATIRMTPEMAKGLALFLYHQIALYEKTDVRIDLPPRYMDAISSRTGIDRAGWDRFWGYTQ